MNAVRTFVNEVMEILRHPKENNVAFGIIGAATIAIGSGVIRFSLYLFNLGGCFYWGISPQNIDIPNGNTIFFMAFWVVIILMLITSNSCASYIAKKIPISPLPIIGVLLLLISIASVYSMPVIFLMLGIERLWLSVVVIVFIFFVLFFVGIMNGIFDRTSKRKKLQIENTEKQNIEKHFSITDVLGSGFLLSIFLIVMFALGYYFASNKLEYKTINNNEMIIYETSSNYILSPYEMKDGQIALVKNSKQKLVEKVGLEYQKIEFNKVNKE